jgi:hypothetical protein
LKNYGDGRYGAKETQMNSGESWIYSGAGMEGRGGGRSFCPQQ